ncbi:hypothetical protein BD413DRAFT_484470 [Trametes elegans]|nr:hypothetical protein BD413DRAFT_484470 [Trametes elegans]
MSHTFMAQSGGRYADAAGVRGDPGQSDSPVMLHVPYVERTQHVSPTVTAAHGFLRRNSPPLEPTQNVRYSPYPSPLSSTTSRYAHSAHGLAAGGSAEVSPTATTRPPVGARTALPITETIRLPPIRPPSGRSSVDDGTFHLPPISSMDNLREAQCAEPMAVLRRLQCADEPPEPSARSVRPTAEMLAQRRHSLAVDPVYRLSDPSPPPSASVSVSGRTDEGPRTPLSAAAALPPLSYVPLPRHAPGQPPRSAVDQSETPRASGARGPVRDDRLTQSLPPSPYLDDARQVPPDYRVHADERRPQPPQSQERVFARQAHPLSPPPSATSSGSSPSDVVRPAWRPW